MSHNKTVQCPTKHNKNKQKHKINKNTTKQKKH